MRGLSCCFAVLRRLPALAIAAAVVLLALPAASAVAAPRPATPQLIEQDVRGKRIPPRRGHLYRAYAIGRPEKLPSAYRSETPWDGTMVLLHLRREVARMQDGPTKREIETVLRSSAASTSCSSASSTLAGETSSANFYVQYGTIGGGLTIADYVTSLEQSHSTQVGDFGWAPPPVAPTPAPGSKYHVRIEALAGGLYGYVSSGGTHAGPVGDNPSTAWDEGDALASCMVLNSDFDPFPGTPQQALDATVAHEYNHSLQYGYGAAGAGEPDDVFFEGGATWMEDEVFDASDDNHNYLWPHFHDSMGDYDGSPYTYWITFRGLTERFGTGAAGAGEDVMQRFWELTSQNSAGSLGAMDAALVAEGTTLADAFHDYSIAAGFTRACGGGYALPHCFEEASAYVAIAKQAPAVHGTIATLGETFSHTVEDNFAIRWVTLPASSGPYMVSLHNTATAGPGRLRATAACDTGMTLRLRPLAVASDGETESRSFDPTGCVRTLLSITNETKTADNPTSSTLRGFTVSTGPLTQHNLTVGTDGTGAGSVLSTPAGIDCGSTCTAEFLFDTVVTLTPEPGPDSVFAGWDGACTGTGACELTMTQAQAVTATFTAVEPPAPPTTPAPVSPAPVTPAPGPSVPAVDTTAPVLSISARSLRADRRGRIRLPIACASGEPAACRGTVRLKLGRRTAGKRSFEIAPGKKQAVRLRLTRAARKRLARSRSIRLRATVVVTDAAGNSRTVTRTLRVRPAR